MGRATIDYKEAERRFVAEEQSIRQICRDLGLKSWSSMAEKAKREDWEGKRAAYKSAIARRSYDHMADAIAGQRTEIRNEAILAGRATLRSYLNKLATGDVVVTAKDAQLWAAFLLNETAGAAQENTPRDVTPLDPDLLRTVVEVARGRVAPTGDLGPTALVIATRARPD